MQKKENILGTFIKGNPVLSLLFAISVILLIKNSKIPMSVNLGLIGEALFMRPSGKLWVGVPELVDVFTGAYTTSLLFYFLVEYVPSENKRVAAMTSIYPEIKNLNIYLSYFIAMLETSQCKAGIENLDKLLISDETVYVKVDTIFQNRTSETTQSYNLYRDTKNYAKLILKSSRRIADSPLSNYCDGEFLAVIGMLMGSSTLIYNFEGEDNDIVDSNESFSIIKKFISKQGYQVLALQESVDEFKNGLNVIRQRYPELPSERFVLMSDDEIQFFKEKQKEEAALLVNSVSQEKNNA
ncbi:MAG: hypothetical protein VZR00_09710 [Lachnospiraceae bacterium]|nr:hypothetical protein [Lachnospiraceae bacterium]